MRSVFPLLLLLLGGCDFFRTHPPTPEERAQTFVKCFREEFSPTDEQLALLKDKILRATDVDKKSAEDLRAANEDLDTKLESEADESELLVGFARVKELKDQLSESHFRKMLALRAVLTVEQRKKFLACKRRMGPSQLPHEG